MCVFITLLHDYDCYEQKKSYYFVQLISGTPLIGVIKHLHPRSVITIF